MIRDAGGSGQGRIGRGPSRRLLGDAVRTLRVGVFHRRPEQLAREYEEYRKLLLFAAMVGIGTPTLLGYSLHLLSRGEYAAAALEGAVVLVLVAGFLFSRRGSRPLVYRISTWTLGGLFLVLFALGGAVGERIFWVFLLPLVAFFMLGRTEGLALTGCSLLVVALVFHPPGVLPFRPFAYPAEFEGRFLLTYLFIAVVAFVFEVTRGRFHAGMERGQQQLEAEREEQRRLVARLQSALEEVKTLRGLIPICAGCKKVRDDAGSWNLLEQYFGSRADVQFSHGLCPECLARTKGEIRDYLAGRPGREGTEA